VALPHNPGDHALVWNDEALQAPENFRLAAGWDAEADAGADADAVVLPARYRGRVFGRNLSPALTWTDLPAGTAVLAVVAQDPDTPMSGASTHLVALVDPAVVPALADGDLSAGTGPAGVVLGRGTVKLGWAGPMPPKGHGPHRYIVQVYALDRRPALRPGFRLADLRGALGAGILGRARLVGTYENS
jgi:Raf kinase inhibitor-like YbhB/YbcL family protein